MIIERVDGPSDLKCLSYEDLSTLATEIRAFIVKAVSTTGGHLGSNLGVVELTLALHRVFESPRDLLLWDTGHQAYVHKALTGRRGDFASLRQEGGMSGYPNRAESAHDWVENSHASTILSYAHGLSASLRLGRGPRVGQAAGRRVVAVIGDGALTGGLAYEALNNLGHAASPVIVVFNDNGRSYAPTVSNLTASSNAGGGDLAPGRAPHQGCRGFFEALGLAYTGPFDGHDIPELEAALRDAAAVDGPVVVHVLTRKGKGYAPAEDDQVDCLHDLKVPGRVHGSAPEGRSYIEAFTQAMLAIGAEDPALVGVTAAMPGSTGLLPFAARYPDRFFDVGIAEAHAVTTSAGMAMGGLHPVVALYATFFSRAFDQANLDVGLHRAPVVFALSRAGVTGDDGPSHHGVLDLAQCLSIPGMAVFAPSNAEEVGVMLRTALSLHAPAAIRLPKTPAVGGYDVGTGQSARLLVRGDGRICILAVGKMVSAAAEAVDRLERVGVHATCWDVRAVRPPDPEMIASAASHELVVTVEDGIRIGGAGSLLADAVASLRASKRGPSVLVLGLPHRYMPHARPDAILARLGLDGAGIAASVIATLQAGRPPAGAARAEAGVLVAASATPSAS